MSLHLGGVCVLCSKSRGGQYFAAEGLNFEGPPLKVFLSASLTPKEITHIHFVKGGGKQIMGGMDIYIRFNIMDVFFWGVGGSTDTQF